MNMCGVYEILHTPSGKRYVGSTKNFSQRKTVHFSALRNGKHVSKKLQALWTESDGEGFVFNEIAQCKPKNLCLFEQMVIDSLCPDLNVALVARRHDIYQPSTAMKLRSFSLSDRMFAELKCFAAAEDKPMSEVVRQAIEEFLSKHR